MFSSLEVDYILSLINTYQRLGYKYYMCHTITENDNSYNSSTHHRDYVSNSNLTKIVSVHQAEFIYTNAVVETSSNTVVNPDLLLNQASNYNDFLLISAGVLLCGTIFLYMFFKSILRLKR